MRIAFMNPTYWPEVRRGSERIVHDLGVALVERGHEVTLLTTHRGPREITVEDGIRVDRIRRPEQPAPLRWYEQYLTTVPAAWWRLLSGDYEIAHAFYPSDAYAAALARPLGGPRYVFAIHGVPTRQYLVSKRYRLEMLKRATLQAGAVTVLSEAAAEAARRYLLLEPRVVPGGVAAAAFHVDAELAAAPTLLCAASLADPRKRGRLLLDGFRALRSRVPEAHLVLAGGADMPDYGPDGLELPDGVSRLDADRTDVLVHAYANAWASVLPSVEEAFGLVLIESLAAGTPVVGARSGSVPEIVTDERLGRIFEPDDADDMARAMGEALALADANGVADACRARAAEYDWSRVADRVESLYTEVLDR
jgi:phosphatidylinositol alpha-mannosyltransferase